MNADEFVQFAIALMRALAVVFLLFAGYAALACTRYLKRGHVPPQGAPTLPGDTPQDKPRRHYSAGANLE